MNRLNEIELKRDFNRDQWRKVRKKRLELQDELMLKGLTKKEIRKNKEYRALKKEQQRFSKIIKHLEKKLNKLLRHMDKKKLS